MGRMPAVDRAVLRVAVFELLTDAVPRAVVIDEAVELAKEYSTENSGRFVNGVLAGVLGKRTGSSAQAVVEAHAESAPTATVASAAHDEEE